MKAGEVWQIKNGEGRPWQVKLLKYMGNDEWESLSRSSKDEEFGEWEKELGANGCSTGESVFENYFRVSE